MTGSLVGCRLWGCTELDTTEATKQQQLIHYDLIFTLMKFVKALFQDQVAFICIGGLLKLRHIFAEFGEGEDTIQPLLR